jgi:hypothetical protein
MFAAGVVDVGRKFRSFSVSHSSGFAGQEGTGERVRKRIRARVRG